MQNATRYFLQDLLFMMDNFVPLPWMVQMFAQVRWNILLRIYFLCIIERYKLYVYDFLGDFGGPVFQEIGGVFYLAGVSSFNTECGIPDVPTVHSRIDYHLSWIQGVTSNAILCGGPPASKHN